MPSGPEQVEGEDPLNLRRLIRSAKTGDIERLTYLPVLKETKTDNAPYEDSDDYIVVGMLDDCCSARMLAITWEQCRMSRRPGFFVNSRSGRLLKR
jgi:hypothetical protein